MENILDFVTPHIDPIIVLMVILGGYFSQLYMKDLNMQMAIKTLIVGTVFAAIYYLLLWMQGAELDLVKGFISYTVATSLYELILKHFKFKKGDTKGQ